MSIPNAQGKKGVVDALHRLLGDTYTLAFKTHGYHWNVVGPHFQELHAMFQTQYEGLYDAADEIAERIRALDAPVTATFGQFGKVATVKAEGDSPDAKTMIANLRDAHQAAAKTCYEVAEVAEAADDIGSADLATQRVREHEKQAWMLASLLK